MSNNNAGAEVITRLQRPEDDEGIVALLQATFGRWPSFDPGVPAIDHLRWKRLSHPEAADYNMVAELDGKIVGTQMYMVQDVKVGDRLFRSANGVDICVHPDVQRRGIRRAMLDFAWERVEVNTPFLLMFVSPHPAMNAATERLGAWRTSFANELFAFESDVSTTALPENPTTVAVRQLEEFDDRTDAFCVAASEPFQLIVARSQRYLNWRYADPRAGGFSIFVAEEAGELVGYITFRSVAGRGYIGDLLSLPGRNDTVGALLQTALAAFRNRGVSIAQCWSPMDHPYRAPLTAAGFARKQRTIPMRTRARGRNEDPVEFAADPHAAIHIMAGDSDLI